MKKGVDDMAFTRPDNNKSIWRTKPDVLQDQSSTVKADFDRLLNENTDDMLDLIDELEGATGAANIGAAPFTGITGTTVQGQIEQVQGKIDDLVVGIVPENSIDTAKIQDGAVTAAKIADGVVFDPTAELNAIRREVAVINLKRLAEGRTEDAVNNFGRKGFISFNVTLDDAYTDLTATASSGQKILTVSDTTDFAVGEEITIQDSTNTENHIIDTVDSATQITLKTNLANTYTEGAVYRSAILEAAYNLINASYDSKSFSVASQDTSPYGIFFKPDGTKMFVLGNANDRVYQYSLSTAWDISTASYDSTYFSVSSQDSVPIGISFKPDGTKMYISGGANDSVYQYSLSTAWDISTASYDSKSFSTATQDASPFDMSFKPDGTKMYILGTTNDAVYQYSLSTEWDISTASYDSIYFSVSSQDASSIGIYFKSDGTKMYMVGAGNDRVYQYSLSTAWDISTASYDGISFSVASQDTNPYSVFFTSDGTKMFVLGIDNDTVYQYLTQGTLHTTIVERLIIDTSNLDITQIAHYVEDNKVATDIQEAVSIISSGDETYLAMDKALYVDNGATQENVFTKTVGTAGDTVVIRRTVTKTNPTDDATISQEVGGLA
jgi:sugar lactone lactonase YvrE